jgi:hypothetical protein
VKQASATVTPLRVAEAGGFIGDAAGVAKSKEPKAKSQKHPRSHEDRRMLKAEC